MVDENFGYLKTIANNWEVLLIGRLQEAKKKREKEKKKREKSEEKEKTRNTWIRSSIQSSCPCSRFECICTDCDRSWPKSHSLHAYLLIPTSLAKWFKTCKPRIWNN